MPDEKGNPIQGEPGHYRYLKDKNANGVGKVTGLDTLKNMGREIEREIDDQSYSKEQVKKMNRDEQEDILKKRKVKFNSKDKEKDLINKILKGNPKE